VDKVGQNLGTSWWWPAGGRWPRPPLGRFGGGDCGGTKHLQKKFLKKIKKRTYQTSQIVQKCQLHKQRSNRMKSKLATVIINGHEWIVIDTDEEKDGKVFCTLMGQDGLATWHAWIDKDKIEGIV
jgi:hypothetical protein